MTGKRLLLPPVAAMLLMLLVPVTATADGSQALVGSWNVLAQGAGLEETVLITFNEGGTAIASAPLADFSAIHGIWQKVGSNTFVAKTRSFQYGASGEVELVFKSLEVIELSSDGQSYSTEIETTIELPDGTVVVPTITVSASATRVNIDL